MCSYTPTGHTLSVIRKLRSLEIEFVDISGLDFHSSDTLPRWLEYKAEREKLQALLYDAVAMDCLDDSAAS